MKYDLNIITEYLSKNGEITGSNIIVTDGTIIDYIVIQYMFMYKDSSFYPNIAKEGMKFLSKDEYKQLVIKNRLKKLNKLKNNEW